MTLVACDSLQGHPPPSPPIPAVAGGLAGFAMDQDDRHRLAGALEMAPSGQSTKWRNAETGNSYVFTTTRSFGQRDAICRDFLLDAWVAGHDERSSGTACKGGDGVWRARP